MKTEPPTFHEYQEGVAFWRLIVPFTIPLVLIGLVCVLLLCTGCSVKGVTVEKPGAITTETKPDGTVVVTETTGTTVSVNWSSLLRDDSAEGFKYSRSEGEIGLELGQLGSKTDWEAIKQYAEFMAGVANPAE